jgi:AcrR family transcriptional regulator
LETLRTDKSSQILEAANHLFAQEGVGAPTARIAKHARVSNGTLFNYFPTKAELFQALYAFLRAKITIELEQIAPEGLDTHRFFYLQWEAYILWAIQHPVDYHTLQLLKTSRLIEPDKVDDQDKIFICLRHLIEKEIQAGRFKPLSIDLILKVCIAHLDATIAYILKKSPTGEARAAVIESSFAMLWDGYTGSSVPLGESE